MEMGWRCPVPSIQYARCVSPSKGGMRPRSSGNSSRMISARECWLIVPKALFASSAMTTTSPPRRSTPA
eukprot:12928903-Prorocentrum_lima.AAC.1